MSVVEVQLILFLVKNTLRRLTHLASCQTAPKFAIPLTPPIVFHLAGVFAST